MIFGAVAAVAEHYGCLDLRCGIVVMASVLHEGVRSKIKKNGGGPMIVEPGGFACQDSKHNELRTPGLTIPLRNNLVEPEGFACQ